MKTTTYEWVFSTPKMTVWVREVDGMVVDCAPIVKRFIGQEVCALLGWLTRQETRGKHGKIRQHLLSQE